MAIGVVSGCPLRALGLQALAEAEGFPLAWIAPTAAEALARVRRQPPAALLIDFALPDGSGPRLLHALRQEETPLDGFLLLAEPHPAGLALAREIRRRGWPIRILLLSAYDDEALIREAMAVGVEGYLLKSEGLEAIAAAVQSVARGLTAFSPEILARARGLPERGGGGLTEREREILELVAEGLTNRAIAQRLRLSPRTVEYHLGQIFQRLGVSSRAAAVKEAMRRGWLQGMRHPSEGE